MWQADWYCIMTSFILIPFYRIRGTQIFPSRDSGTEFVALSDDDSRVYEHRPKTTVVDIESEDAAGYMVDFQG